MSGGAIPMILSLDNGKYSNKYKSKYGEGSFLSVAASASRNSSDFMNSITDKNSLDLDIFYHMDNEGRFDPNPQRFIVGNDAEGMEGALYNTSDMNRTQNIVFSIFLCGALLGAFPSKGRDIKELEANRGVINRTWMSPVKLMTSVAPGYMSKRKSIIESSLGEYAFIDRKTNKLYCFKIEDVEVIPESFGGFMTKLYEEKNNDIVAVKNKEQLERVPVACLDFGGQTTDFSVWDNHRLITSGSLDVGLHQHIDKIIKNVMETFPEFFATQPTRATIMESMRNVNKNKRVIIPGIGGMDVDITDLVDHRMRIFANEAVQLYQDKLNSGQGIRVLIYMGGVSLAVKPYMDRIKHKTIIMVAKDPYRTYMANAIGGYYWAVNRWEDK